LAAAGVAAGAVAGAVIYVRGDFETSLDHYYNKVVEPT